MIVPVLTLMVLLVAFAARSAGCARPEPERWSKAAEG
jgi:hypothetical protein